MFFFLLLLEIKLSLQKVENRNYNLEEIIMNKYNNNY